MCVTLSTADDFEELTELWEASVRATHHFIPEQYILKLKPLVWSVYLRSMPVYTVRGPERIEGFMGINGDMLEMLFVHPQAMGKGVGKKLLKYAINSCRVRYVDVNEQNEQAYGFYRHLGFKVIGRDATDASGEPYPILHLKIKGKHENRKLGNSTLFRGLGKADCAFQCIGGSKAGRKTIREQNHFCGTSTCLYVGEERKRCEYVVG